MVVGDDIDDDDDPGRSAPAPGTPINVQSYQ
eukprot:CAMPEP_0168229278 /NCGR_PEP_ID=MMETSP0140_2-20121125/15185_1 /TAXON_ID=44445 /ORGANISM="Pseudo-nitzschia australis, Strain 10249 10 AB" /LENGTH=30 /DNA_ID= /DNA_START= /DNA_END= /DNA_ORIENTATION=